MLFENPKMAIKAVNVEFQYAINYLDIYKLLSNPFKKQESVPILQKISIAVPKGKIYALLGSSGCGKTTLLRCILGRLQPTGGSIEIFGQKPGSVKCTIPGAGVGYMPQDLTLCPDFTITETFQYFGQLYGLPADAIKSETECMINFLHLPENDKLIKELSGGQQRRVSLACALIHRPPLMILDEPTVGVDPLLRVTIWNRLKELCSKHELTVILTTHYIEEARGAETIGLIRNGQLLVEANPDLLLAQHNLLSLEDVYLKLSLQQDKFATDANTASQSENLNECELFPIENHPSTGQSLNNQFNSAVSPFNVKQRHAYFDLVHFNALFTKNWIRLRRNLPLTLFYSFLPVLQFSLLMFALGKVPHNIPVAVVNEESPSDLTGEFTSFLNGHSITPINMKSIEEAKKTVIEGKTSAVVQLYSNFSFALDERRIELINADDSIIEASNIHLYLDNTNQVLSAFILNDIAIAFKSVVVNFLKSLGYNPNALSVPIDITEVVYGTMEVYSFAELFTPGFIIIIAFLSTAAVTGIVLVVEQKDGFLERSIVAGVRPFECLLSHACTQILALFGQQILLMFTIFYLFNVPSKGPCSLVFLICILQGIVGIMYGFFISAICPDVISAQVLTAGSVLPMLMLSGVFWPIQNVSVWLYGISIFLPQTLAIDSVRSVLARGWTLERTVVWLGIASSTIWIFVYLLLAACFLFFKLYK